MNTKQCLGLQAIIIIYRLYARLVHRRHTRVAWLVQAYVDKDRQKKTYYE